LDIAVAVAVTAFVTPKLAAAQSQQDQSRDQANRNDNANNLMYQQGLDHGQADRANNQAHQYRLQPIMRTIAVPMSLDTIKATKIFVMPIQRAECPLWRPSRTR